MGCRRVEHASWEDDLILEHGEHRMQSFYLLPSSLFFYQLSELIATSTISHSLTDGAGASAISLRIERTLSKLNRTSKHENGRRKIREKIHPLLFLFFSPNFPYLLRGVR